ncbi:hypothetical protein D8T00_08230 [Salmonella enterica]|nr:hypothetical protein [Salmonella enterica]
MRNFRLATEDIIEGYIRYREKYFVVAIMKLCRELGLRTDEAILGMDSLTTWLKRVNADMPTVHIVFGNRGSNYRHAHIINRERVREALRFVINVWEDENNGCLCLKKHQFSSCFLFVSLVNIIAFKPSLSDHQCSRDLRGTPSGDHNTNVPAI